MPSIQVRTPGGSVDKSDLVYIRHELSQSTQQSPTAPLTRCSFARLGRARCLAQGERQIEGDRHVVPDERVRRCTCALNGSIRL